MNSRSGYCAIQMPIFCDRVTVITRGIRAPAEATTTPAQREAICTAATWSWTHIDVPAVLAHLVHTKPLRSTRAVPQRTPSAIYHGSKPGRDHLRDMLTVPAVSTAMKTWQCLNMAVLQHEGLHKHSNRVTQVLQHQSKLAVCVNTQYMKTTSHTAL